LYNNKHNIQSLANQYHHENNYKNHSIYPLYNYYTGPGCWAGYRKELTLGGLNGAHILLKETEDDYARIRITNSLNNASTNNRFWDIAGRIGSDNSGQNDRLNFYSKGSETYFFYAAMVMLVSERFHQVLHYMGMVLQNWAMKVPRSK